MREGGRGRGREERECRGEEERVLNISRVFIR